jgi:outer membrane protein assembly factor BamB
MQTKHGHGEGCSPVLHGDRIFVNWDHEGLSFIGALDKTTGKKIWRKPRNERTTWTSPIVIEHEGKPQLIAAGTERIRAYDPGDGELIWECGGLSDNVVATPVYESGRLLATSSYDFQSMLAIDLVGASGDLTDSDHIKWTRRKRTPYIPSPLLVNGHVFYLAHYQGVLSRVNLKTGDELTGPFRLGNLRDIYASPVAAKGRIYVVDRSGITLVLSDDPEPQPLAQNQLNDRFSATPALVGRALFLRGESFLYCLSNLEE